MTDEFFQFKEAAKPEPSAALKRAQSLVGTSAGRPDHDYYPTPPEATEALLARESFVGSIWEPACGDGAICEVLLTHGHSIIATDLIYRGYGEPQPLDFLKVPDHHTADNIITNPPFKYAEEFIHMSLARTTGKVAMLCKLQFLEGGKRRKMFESTPLKTVYVFSKRLSMTRNGEKMKNSWMIAFAWFVWDHSHEGDATIAWI